MSKNYDVIIIFPIYGWFEAIRKPNSGRMVYNSDIFININLPKTNKNNKRQATGSIQLISSFFSCIKIKLYEYNF